jgi:hypothetical protein
MKNAKPYPGQHYIVQTACAQMPNSCWGNYRRVAVLRVDEPWTTVAMISDRAYGCREVVATWERCNVGRRAIRCAYTRAVAEATELAARLNGENVETL